MSDKTLFEQTSYVMENPKAGDVFTEMFSFWVYVVYRKGNKIGTLIAHGGNTIPPDGKVAETTLEKFQNRFRYNIKALKNKYWVTLTKRKADVSGMLEYWDKFEKDFGYEDEPKQIPIKEIKSQHGLTRTECTNIAKDIFDAYQLKPKMTKVNIRNTITHNLTKNGLLIEE